jgi:putative phosphoesterase
MRIAVLTDTHVGSVQELPGAMLRALAEADLIVHAGDFTEPAVLEGLRKLGEVKAVCGNMDSRGIQMALPRKELFVAAGKKIGLVHGWGVPFGIAGRVRGEFDDVDAVVFGHSHLSCNERIKGALMFNPGRCRNSYGLLTVEEDIEASVVES